MDNRKNFMHLKNRKDIYLILIASVLFISQIEANAKSNNSTETNLKLKKSGVLQFEMYKNRNKPVPRLSIGEEPKLEFPDLKMNTDYKISPWNSTVTTSNKNKELINYSKDKLPAITEAKVKSIQENIFKSPEPWIAPKDLNSIEPKKIDLNQVKIQELSNDEISLIQALLILERQKKYTLAYAMLAELYSHGEKKNREKHSDITYHLASAAKLLKLNFESRRLLLEIAQRKEDLLAKAALIQLMKNAESGDLELVQKIDSLIDNLGIEEKNASQYQINRAKFYLAKGQLSQADHALGLVDEKSDLFNDARFLKSIFSYKSGQPKKALAELLPLYNDLEKNSSESEIKSISALTLARIYFQIADYKSAFKYYLGVNKAHPEWPQAMIEQAWSQLLAEDAEGAAGNMFGLHSDFFKTAFVPESYAVRAAAYLHLCQFGQAAKTVKMMTGRYSPLKEKLVLYEKDITPKQNPNKAYDTVRTFFKEAKLKEIDGLPRSFVWSLARTPAFISEQQLINSLEDQKTRFGQISIDLIEQEKQILADQNKLISDLNNLAEGKSKNISESEKIEMQNELSNLKTQYSLSKNLRQSAKSLRTAGLFAIESEKTRRKNLAAVELNKKLQQMSASLSQSIDQIEVLQYEIYSGAGEHLRYQASGGKIDPKESKPLTIDEAKNQKWEFEGEIWEDELGHYRSSLKNVCAETK